ncbi:pectin lyase-like protein [Lindgomyces ingoldianus]|uniref:Pectin lyase-like protein n=1 Tax=Lindgomyces ingoldianus TaxID=673940 RepID=A0ACB6R9D6_9PLEO|nr:pectin lyase-like protein [Lindgomyces ingoldianus]KAF2475869.1 pectin lyase-like protein [Lindgomyces ingoldianus]
MARLLFFILAAIIEKCVNANRYPATSLEKRATCTPLAQGYEMIDDAPAINDAIKKCGNGGTIALPADQIYSIRSPIDFSTCRNCDFQLEGQLLFSSDPDYWDKQKAMISMSGVQGAKLRSLTGKGLIDGNARIFYQRNSDTYGRGLWKSPVFNLIRESSTNILIDNLTIKNMPFQFFRVDERSSNIRFTRLSVIAENQAWYMPWTRSDTIGFQFRNCSSITMDSINVDFKSVDTQPNAGACVGIDYGTSNININNIQCSTFDGVMIMFGTVVDDKPFPAAGDQTAKNIYISNYTAKSIVNGGFRNLPDYNYPVVSNLTYDGVTVTNGTSLIDDLCFKLDNGRSPGQCSVARSIYKQATFSDIWFKNFKGKVGPASLDCFNPQSTCDFHFDNWVNTTVL